MQLLNSIHRCGLLCETHLRISKKVNVQQSLISEISFI